jgi:uncharacterized protein YbjT (DUF2867 family)
MRRVLVTGATGTIGSQVVRRLAAHDDLAVRAFVRNIDRAAPLRAAGAALAQGTFENPTAVYAACHGIDTLVLITPANPHAASQAGAALTAARAAGIRKIVRLSAFKAAVDGPTAVTRLHGRTDQEIQASGLTSVILRPPFFMQNLLFLTDHRLVTEGTLHFGVGDGKIGMIDARDVVDCIERCVVSDAYDDQVFTLTGPESIGFGEVADRLSQILGRPVRYVPMSPEEVEGTVLEMALPAWYARVMRDLCSAYRDGWGDTTTDSVAGITLRAPRGFDAFAREVLAPALGWAAGRIESPVQQRACGGGR